jgi:hypothetical protein
MLTLFLVFFFFFEKKKKGFFFFFPANAMAVVCVLVVLDPRGETVIPSSSFFLFPSFLSALPFVFIFEPTWLPERIPGQGHGYSLHEPANQQEETLPVQQTRRGLEKRRTTTRSPFFFFKYLQSKSSRVHVQQLPSFVLDEKLKIRTDTFF